MRKCLFVLVLMATVLIGTGNVSATEIGNSLKEPEVIDVPNEEVVEGPEVPDRETTAEDAQTVFFEWDKYANHYYYNQLSPQLQKAWDELDAICERYGTQEKDIPHYYTNKENGSVKGYLDWVTLSEELTREEMLEFWWIFTCSNPQYYFLSNSYMRSGTGTNADGVTTYKKMALVVYDAFWEGESRLSATENVKQQLDAWQLQIDACATDSQKVQMIQDLICAKVTYNHDANNDLVDEQVSFSQSPYSVFCGDMTVCAGYADAFYMLCNVSGIDALSVTSPGHQWNKARINSVWYNFDVTWDDTVTDSKGYAVYRYHGRSDAMYDVDMNSGQTSNIENHQEEAFWDGLIPACNLDTNPTENCRAPGEFIQENGQVATPEITVSYAAGMQKVTLSCETEQAVLYYTTDGTDPLPINRKTFKYKDEFFVQDDIQLKVMAVCETYTDSEIVEKVIKLEKYPITYVLNGGENHEANPVIYTSKDEIELQTAARVGYLFEGWYLEDTFVRKVTKIAQGSVGTMTLYAKWTPIRYHIDYKANGATSGMTSPMTCLYDKEYVLAENVYEKNGYTFNGWNTNADGTGTFYADRASVKNLSTAEGAVITLYAQWRANSYAIKFNKNKAGKGSMKAMSSLIYGQSYTLSANKYKRTGYRFNGWNTKKSGKGISYKNKETVRNLSSQDGAEVTLYAQWKANKYNVKFHGNGATSGSMKKMKSRTYDKKFNLSPNKFKRKGYKFVGWNTKKNGKGKMYKNKAKVKNLTSKNGKTVTLYAQWKKVKK